MRDPAPPFVHLHFPLPHEAGDLPPRARSGSGLLFRDPVEIVVARTPGEVVPALRRIEIATEEGRWGAGYVAYEAWPGLDPDARVRSRDRNGSRLPLVWFGLFAGPIRTPPPDDPPAERSGDPPSASIGAWESEWSAPDHARRVEKVRRGIERGDVYQVNLTFRLRARVSGSPAAAYRRLLRSQGRAYGAHVALGSRHLLSASPELFLLRRGEVLETRPMKGTRGRGRWPAEDRALARALERSEKDRAENAMIVDLLRNDLGRVCTFGSVRVPRAFRIESYRTVHQMTSSVRGRLEADAGLTEIFRALFPCGSITGAPKLAAGDFIRRLETSPRGAYCGAVGLVAPGGDFIFNVAIRTLEWDTGRGEAVFGTGGGVTWDSSSAGEHDEALRKAEVLRSPPPRFDLIETLRVEGAWPLRLDRHLDRLVDSAAYWDFDVDRAAVRAAAENAATAHGSGRGRLRIRLERTGRTGVDCEELAGPVGAPTAGAVSSSELLPVRIDDDPLDPDDPLLYHKTTLRRPYRARRERCPDVYDVVLVNTRGEITETTRANLVAEIDGELLTPPIASGLLPGILRTMAVEEGRVREAVLTIEDLRRATRLWGVSSLRGWLAVSLTEGSAPGA